MFYNCTSLKQSLVNFKFNAATNINLLLGACNINTGSTTTNYDNTLVAWAASAPPSGLIFQANNCKYSDTGKAGRDILTGTYGWTITDGGHQ